MTKGVHGTTILLTFVLSLAEFISEVAEGGPTVLLKLGKLIDLLQKAVPIFDAIPEVISESSDGYTDEEKTALYAAIDKLEIKNVAVEVIVEKGLKAIIALTSLIEIIKGSK